MKNPYFWLLDINVVEKIGQIEIGRLCSKYNSIAIFTWVSEFLFKS